MVKFIRLQSLTVLVSALSCFGGADCTWWFLSQLQLSAVGGSRVMCDNIPGLARRQRHLCQKNPDVMVSISRGARTGVTECQRLFQDNRWNCSTIDRDASVFGKVMLKIGSRETAFVYAISSAGVVHSITRSCSKGELLNCACDPTKQGTHRDAKGEFAWGGCSDYVSYGNTFSRKFIDAREKRVRDARALMNLHNNRAGRKAVQKHVKLECKCHGVSGSCTVRTCWTAMMEFGRVGTYLKKKYDGATEVMMNQAGTGLIVANKHHKRPTRTDQVYFEPSPDYCVSDDHTGSLGTSGRTCNKTSLGTDGCDIMCCGRGYDTTRVQRVTKCECKFQWCCYVKCKQCKEWSEEYTCKTPKNETPAHVAAWRGLDGLRRTGGGAGSGSLTPRRAVLHSDSGYQHQRAPWRAPTPSTLWGAAASTTPTLHDHSYPTAVTTGGATVDNDTTTAAAVITSTTRSTVNDTTATYRSPPSATRRRRSAIRRDGRWRHW